jgi:anhydro-N-acetylmuramic acid kinase
METYRVIGLMSGSSMDGLDIAYCVFEVEDNQWTYKIEHAECVPYPEIWRLRLQKLTNQNAITYIKTHTYYGHYIGDAVNSFIEKHDLQGKVDLISSHGQTIFHQPENMLTSQIGDGAAIASKTKVPVVANFRTKDVAEGGQGAPITPIGDQLLFSDFNFCLNLGGIANLTANSESKIIGYDVCAVNLVLDRLSSEMGYDYDDRGQIARTGRIDDQLLEELDRSWYYKKEAPKTLGGGWVRKVLMPTLHSFRLPKEDLMATYVEHIARQVDADIIRCCEELNMGEASEQKVLVTGGGVFNDYLIERINACASAQILTPDDTVVKFKEALILALIGCLRQRNEINVLASVTGARQDTIGGEIYV